MVIVGDLMVIVGDLMVIDGYLMVILHWVSYIFFIIKPLGLSFSRQLLDC